jgi:hypothetical protein
MNRHHWVRPGDEGRIRDHLLRQRGIDERKYVVLDDDRVVRVGADVLDEAPISAAELREAVRDVVRFASLEADPMGDAGEWLTVVRIYANALQAVAMLVDLPAREDAGDEHE